MITNTLHPPENWPTAVFRWDNPPAIKDPESLEYHSIINILNVITIVLGTRCLDNKETDEATAILDQANAIAKQIGDSPDNPENALSGFETFNARLRAIIPRMRQGDNAEKDAADILDDVLLVLEVRLEELFQRLSHPGQWITIRPEDINRNLKQMFLAVEKNSKGRYQIVYDLAKQQPTDYLVNISLKPGSEGCFKIPPILIDCMRDLAANSRKYSNPGALINISLEYQNGTNHLRVCDTGLGIPENEVAEVIRYGYRAGNVKDRRTLGGGYGLTKVLWAAMTHQGEMKIASKEGQGTCIEVTIPDPD